MKIGMLDQRNGSFGQWTDLDLKWGSANDQADQCGGRGVAGPGNASGITKRRWLTADVFNEEQDH